MDEEPRDASARAAWKGQDWHERVPAYPLDPSPQGQAGGSLVGVDDGGGSELRDVRPTVDN